MVGPYKSVQKGKKRVICSWQEAETQREHIQGAVKAWGIERRNWAALANGQKTVTALIISGVFQFSSSQAFSIPYIYKSKQQCGHWVFGRGIVCTFGGKRGVTSAVAGTGKHYFKEKTNQDFQKQKQVPKFRLQSSNLRTEKVAVFQKGWAARPDSTFLSEGRTIIWMPILGILLELKFRHLAVKTGICFREFLSSRVRAGGSFWKGTGSKCFELSA